MCNPALVAAGATLAAGAVSARSSHVQGKTQENIAKQNALLAEQDAERKTAAAGIAEKQASDQARRVAARQRAALAANNVDASSGSALDLQLDTAGESAVDLAVIRSNAVQEAWGFRSEAVNRRNQGRNAAFAGNQQAYGTLISSGANSYGNYRKFS